MKPPLLPQGWQWGLDRMDDWLIVNLYSPTKLVISQKFLTATPIGAWVKLRLYVLLGLWVEIAGRQIGNWLYNRFNKDRRHARRVELAEQLRGDWDCCGNRIEEEA